MAYLSVRLLRIGRARRRVRLRGMAQLLLRACVALLQAGELGSVRLHLLQRRMERRCLRRSVAS